MLRPYKEVKLPPFATFINGRKETHPRPLSRGEFRAFCLLGVVLIVIKICFDCGVFKSPSPPFSKGELSVVASKGGINNPLYPPFLRGNCPDSKRLRVLTRNSFLKNLPLSALLRGK